MSTLRRCPRDLRGRFGVFPPPPSRLFCQRYPITTGKDHMFVINSETAVTCYTHFIDGRDQLCTAPESDKCWISHELTSMRYQCWLAVRLPDSKHDWMIQLTKNAAWCDPRIRGLNEYLRGMTLKVWRKGWWPWAPMFCKLLDFIPPVVFEEEPPNVQAIVEGMYMAADRPKGEAYKKLREAKAQEVRDKMVAAVEARAKGGTVR